jgi:tRNA threonylcarbamoyladenosine biosynthesis protein TsaB
MKFYMLVLALDTTTRAGSAALVRDGIVLECETGDASVTHGERLPGDLMRLLNRQRLEVRDVDLFAVAAGPGSLTGLRIGIAAMQGLALVNARPIVGVSTLDALCASVEKRGMTAFLVGAWLDAQRGEVYAALYRGGQLMDGPFVEKPESALARWARLATSIPLEPIVFVGDGALTYESIVTGVLPRASVVQSPPALAPAIARLAEEAAARKETVAPDAIRPIYVRRSDAELARDRRATSKPISKT